MAMFPRLALAETRPKKLNLMKDRISSGFKRKKKSINKMEVTC